MTESNDLVQYAEAMRIEDPTQCQFYHRMDVPGVGEVGGQWDLRKCIRQYLGDFEFAGKRVLDAGTASGFLTFEMEKLGAEVVSFDMDDGGEWDVVPQKFVRTNPGAYIKQVREDHRRLKNAYWFTHQRLASKARAYYGDIYNLPKGLGRFDAAVMGMIISHLRDPFRAIYNVAQLCDRHLIITNQVYKGKDAVACFAPTTENQAERVWWIFTEKCIIQMLSVMGFDVIRTVVSKPICLAYGKPSEDRCVAFVAQRSESRL